MADEESKLEVVYNKRKERTCCY
ncbi:unnamed protein product [Debaryomyces tyrocola]|nr:unnamed protein product [Debaryomyces tyrocola]